MGAEKKTHAGQGARGVNNIRGKVLPHRLPAPALHTLGISFSESQNAKDSSESIFQPRRDLSYIVAAWLFWRHRVCGALSCLLQNWQQDPAGTTDQTSYSTNNMTSHHFLSPHFFTNVAQSIVNVAYCLGPDRRGWGPSRADFTAWVTPAPTTNPTQTVPSFLESSILSCSSQSTV